MTAPRISVVMPVYNGEPFLREAIGSLLTQTERDFELLVIDDGSTDGSAAILAEFQRRDARVCVVTQPNRGLIATLNDGWRRARGAYIARMDADDISLPERLAQQAAFLDAHPAVGVVGGAIRRVDREGHLLPVQRFPALHAVIAWQMLFEPALIHPAVMLRRTVLALAGGYDPAMTHAEDFDLWVRLSRVTRLHNLTEVVLHLRKHATNVSVVHRGTQIERSTVIRRQAMADLLGSTPPIEQVRQLETLSFASPAEVQDAFATVRRLCRAAVRAPGVTPTEQRLIMRDAATRLLLVGKYSSGDWNVLAPLAGFLLAHPWAAAGALAAWGARRWRV